MAGVASGQSPSRLDYSRFDRRTFPLTRSKNGEAASAAGLITRARAILRTGSPLSAARAGDPEAIARDYLSRLNNSSRGKTQPDLDWALTARYETPKAGLTHLVFEPQWTGVNFFDAQTTVHIDRDGRVWRVNQAAAESEAGYLTVTLSQRQAVESAVSKLSPDVELSLNIQSPETGPERRMVLSSPQLYSPVPVRLVWFGLRPQAVAAWEMLIDLSPQGVYSVVVDGVGGEILFSRNLTQALEPWGKVFRAPDRANPSQGARTAEPLTGWPAAGGLCPAEIYPGWFRSGVLEGSCWIEDDETNGNNVDACRDADANNLCDARETGAAGVFDFAFTDSYATTNNTLPDRDAALTNAFYWANAIHDWLYGLGFDEPAGNFQAANFGRGGAEGDAVRIDVEDSSVPNNATFLAPPDGIAPRMQLGLFTYSRHDAAFDADVMIHEYAHGLSTRLIGGPGSSAGLFLWHSGAMSEGWSDIYAASFTADPVVGEYVTGNPTSGLRTVAYDNSPYTFGDMGTLFLKVIPGTGRLLRVPQLHHDGEIWASVLWDVRSALGAEDFEQAVTTGLKLTPSRPSMLDARDAMLQAAQLLGVGGADGCQLWVAFATRGFGASAALNPIEDGQPNDTALSVFASFDLPPACGGVAPAVAATLLFEDAEAGGSGWEATGPWHVSTRRAAAGAYSWWFGDEAAGNYSTGARTFGTLTSPATDLTGVSGALIEWDQYLDGEGFGAAIDLGTSSGAYLNADSGRLMISTDNGVTWQTISHLAHDTAGFEHHRVNLTRYTGQSVRLRFDFDTFDANSNLHEGWFIDNIRVSATGAASGPPTAEWRFDEAGAGSGVTVSDSSGAGNDGLTQGFGTIAVPGVAGNARRLNGSTDAIDFGLASAFTPSSFTVRAWVRLESYPASLGTILSAYGGNYRGWWLGVNSQGRLLFLSAKQPSSAHWLSSADPLPPGGWHHIAVSYDHLAQQASMYVDGSLSTQATIPGLDPETTLPLLAGKASWFPGYYLDLTIDETRIDGYAKTAAEITADFALFSAPAPPAEPAVAARWNFDDGAEDVSSNGHDGVLAGTTQTAGVDGLGRRFDGVSDSMSIPWSPRLTPSRFTLRTWLKLDSYPGGLGVVFANYGGNYQGWYVAVRPDARVLFSLNRLPASSRGVVSSSVLDLNRWYHVTVTYDGRTQRAAVYLDGALEGQAIVAGLTAQDSGTASVGKASWLSGYQLAFSIDETKLVPDVWAPAQVEGDYTSFPAPAALQPAAAWAFDNLGEGSGIVLTDSSGNQHDAITAGAGTSSVAGNSGLARAFDGVSSYATVAPDAGLSAASFSFTAWIKLQALPLGWGVIFSNYGGDYQGWFCGVNSSGRLLLSVAGLPAYSSWLVSDAALAPGQWHHVAFTFDGSIGRGEIYIDGTLDRGGVFGGFTQQTATQLIFGRASWYNGAYLPFSIDTARFYGEKLSAGGIAADMSAP